MKFALFPEETNFWSFADYAAVLAVVQRRAPITVLEFGPGSSTLALIEGGAQAIDCCEDDPGWLNLYANRLCARFPLIVSMLAYSAQPPITVPYARSRYDLALIDGPRSTLARIPIIEYCVQRCDAVLVPTEDWAVDHRRATRPIEDACAELARRYGKTMTVTETGPHAGAFALLC